MKKVHSYIKETGEELDFITLGKKAAHFVVKTGNNLIADFSPQFSDHVQGVFTKEISGLMREEFLSGKYKKVVVFYNYYVNTIKQVAVSKISLPIDATEIKKYLMSILEEYCDLEKELALNVDDYTLEPTASVLAMDIVPIILDMIFHSLLLDAKASEHSSRMVAMKAAKDNAGSIAGHLTLKYNKARQAMITREVSEITAGVESMKEV